MENSTTSSISICSLFVILVIGLISFPLESHAGFDFLLVNAVNNRDIRLMQNNDTIFLNETGRHLNIRADLDGQDDVSRVRFILDNQLTHDENFRPFALAGDIRGNYESWTPGVGFHIIHAIAYNVDGDILDEEKIQFNVLISGDIVLTLVNAATNSDIKELEDHDQVDLGITGKLLNIRADIRSYTSIGNVRFILDQDAPKDEAYSPYTLAGVIGENYQHWTPMAGEHVLTVFVHHPESNVTVQRTLSFTVVDSNEDGHGSDPYPVINSSFNRNRDLISLHFDHCDDPDDGHATVANKVILSYYGLNAHVVSGTYGFQDDPYQWSSESVMTATWGSDGWLNAHNSWNGAVENTVSVWSRVLSNEGHIWIAEGGQSDFTADVLRKLRQNYTQQLLVNRVHLIQHSDWNENHTRSRNLSFVKNNTRYIKIADGNLKGNGTAGLKEDPGNRAGNRRIENFILLARNSIFSDVWSAAFNYLSPRSKKLDFSDTVELLHILGIGTDEVSNCSDFADKYF